MPGWLASIDAAPAGTPAGPAGVRHPIRNPYALATSGMLAGAFLLDLWVSPGVSVWGLYFVPIWLASRWAGDAGAVAATAVACVMTVVAWAVVGEPELVAQVNRVIGVGILTVFGGVVVVHNRLRSAGLAATAGRRSADARREVSERRFQAFLTHLPAVAWIKGPDYRYQYINPTYQEKFALPGTVYVGKDDFGMFPEPVAAELRANDAAVRETGVARQVVETVPTPDGVPHQWLVTKFALPEVGGETSVAGIALDVTAERVAEEKFRLAVEASPAGMVMADPAGRIVLANANAERMFGYATGELAGRSVDDLVPDRVRPRHPDNRARFFADPQVLPQLGRNGPLAGRRRDGTEFPAEVGLSPIRTADGLFALATVTDITARVRAEEARARAAAELARSNRELEQFAYVASHDLQEPLRMVTSYLELLRERYGAGLDAKAHTWIGYAVDGATRMKELIEALLQYSRAGRRTRPFEPIDLGQVVRDALLNLQAAVREAGAVVHVGPLPTVHGDRVQLTQLVQNLVGNALKFRGARPAEVTVGAERDGDGWRFVVRDNGIGIDPKFRDRLFVLFQRLHPRTRYPGTGIGLAMCKRIAERHGGRIWVDSRPDAGAAFYWTIPDREDGCHEPSPGDPAEPVAVGG